MLILAYGILLLVVAVDTEGSGDDEGCTACFNSCSRCEESGTGHAVCVRCTHGGYRCICPVGHSLRMTGRESNERCSCRDINECREGLHNCSAHADCRNTRGSFVCTCHSGYEGDGFSCSVPTPSPRYTAVISSTMQSPTPASPSSDPGSQRGSGGSIAGGVLGASVLLTLLLMGAVVALIVVFKFRKRRTETLEPWPQVKCERTLHNPTYGAEQFKGSCKLTPLPEPPVYEEIESPGCSDTEPERTFNNPLYDDITYSPTDKMSSPHEKNTSTTCIYPTGHEHHNLTKSESRSDDACDYSMLDPCTQYASLEPFTGKRTQECPPHPFTLSITDDYSHLNH